MAQQRHQVINHSVKHSEEIVVVNFENNNNNNNNNNKKSAVSKIGTPC